MKYETAQTLKDEDFNRSTGVERRTKELDADQITQDVSSSPKIIVRFFCYRIINGWKSANQIQFKFLFRATIHLFRIRNYSSKKGVNEKQTHWISMKINPRNFIKKQDPNLKYGHEFGQVARKRGIS